MEMASKRFLVERGLRIALKRHGEGVSKPWSLTQPSVEVSEVGTAIKFLRVFPSTDPLANRAALSLCTIIGRSKFLTPDPALKKELRRSYLQSTKPSSESRWTRANFLGEWQWVRNGLERKVHEWAEVGVVMGDVIELVERARNGGNKLNPHEYTALLKVCLCIQKGRGSHVTSTSSSAPGVGALLDVMVSDCGVGVAQDVLLSSSFQVVTSEDQIRAVSHLLGKSARLRPTIFQTEQLSASLSSDNHAQRVVNLFTQYSQTLQAPPTMHVYESLLSTCARSYQLHWAVGVFNTVTGRHKVAPSRHAYNVLTHLMSRRALNRDQRMTLELCHHVLAVSCGAYDGSPPLWIYAEMAKPLTQLLGTEGYSAMYERCEQELDAMGVFQRSDRMGALRAVWRPALYVSLIRSSVARGDSDLALHMLSEMRRWGYFVGSKAYEYLFQLVRQPGHLSTLLPVLLEGMSVEAGAEGKDMADTLTTPLIAVLDGVCRTRFGGAGGGEQVPGFVSAAGSGLLKAALLSSSHGDCLEELDRLAEGGATLQLQPGSTQQHQTSTIAAPVSQPLLMVQ